MIAQVAAVQDVLTRAGIPAVGVAWWWRQPREQLDGMTPRELAARAGAPAGPRLLELARADVFELEHELPGSDELHAAGAAGPLLGDRPLHAVPGGERGAA